MKHISRIFLLAAVFAGSIVAQELPALFKECAVVDRDAPLPQNTLEREKRIRANSRYDNEGWVSTAPRREGHGGTGRIDEEAPPAPYPVFESTLIALGEITNSAAFLSNDRQGIYTEFTFQLSEILKDDAPAKLNAGGAVVADRAGGCLRFPNGRIMRYGMSDHGLPLVGKTYLLFLKREGPNPNYKILNGYEILGDKTGYGLEYYSSIKSYDSPTTAQLIEAVRYEMAHPVYRVLDISDMAGGPVRITSVKTGFGVIEPGVRFAAEYNWLRRLNVTVENTSGKTVTHVALCVCFPRPEARNDKPGYSYSLERGVDPLRPETDTGYKPEPIPPGKSVELELDDFAYRDVESGLYINGYERGFSRVRLCVKQVGYEDGTLWTAGK
jgi:hypothetical protein